MTTSGVNLNDAYISNFIDLPESNPIPTNIFEYNNPPNSDISKIKINNNLKYNYNKEDTEDDILITPISTLRIHTESNKTESNKTEPNKIESNKKKIISNKNNIISNKKNIGCLFIIVIIFIIFSIFLLFSKKSIIKL